MEESRKTEDKIYKLCACGHCNEYILAGRIRDGKEIIYKHGHHRFGKKPGNTGKGKLISPPQLCACNCGNMTSPGAKFCRGHNYHEFKVGIGKIANSNIANNTVKPKPIQNHHPCACGHCDKLVASDKKFISGHNSYSKKKIRYLHECACGCGESIDTRKKYKNGHYQRGKPGWQRGLTKETDERVARRGRSCIGKSNGWKGQTKETNPALKIVSEKNSISVPKLWLDKDYRSNQVQKHKDWWNEERRDKASNDKKILWKEDVYVSKQMKSRHVKQNKFEKNGENLFNRLFPNEYKFTGYGEVIIGGKCPDFTNVNGQKKLIELFGDYWHRNDNPQDKINHYKKYGWGCLVIWEHEFKDMETLTKKVIEFHELKHEKAEILEKY